MENQNRASILQMARGAIQERAERLQVAQPESMFLLRLKDGGNVGLYEADGGVWKLEATLNIAGYFEEHLKDLISAGRVVVLR